MVAVSGRNCHACAEEDTFVPEEGIFPGGTAPRRVLCPQMAAVSGRKCHLGTEGMPFGSKRGTFSPQKRPFPGRERGVCCICRENREVLLIGVPRRYSREVFPISVGLSLFAQFICLGYGRDDVREDVFFAKFLCKSHFIEVCKDIVVYTAEDYLYVLFL